MRSIFFLSVLICLLVVLPEPEEVKAECTCYDTYSQCQSVAVGQFETCEYQAQGARDLCISDGNPVSICNDNYWNTVAQCEVTYYNSAASCDSALNACLAGCGGGGGGGGGGSVCHWDDQMGYSPSQVGLFTGNLQGCMADGGSAFTGAGLSRDYFDLCMTNTGGTDQEYCCRQQIIVHLNAYASCNLDPRTGCQHCISF